jgi:hypothetical protein
VPLAGGDLRGRTPLDILDLYFQQRKSISPERRVQLLARARDLMDS